MELNSLIWYLGIGAAFYLIVKIVDFIHFRFLAASYNFEQFRSEWALVTGASMGLGQSFADEIAKKGLNVILIARSKEKMEQIGKELNKKYGVKYIAISADLSNEDEATTSNIIKQIKSLTVSVIIANAGAGSPYMKPYWEWDNKDEKYVQTLNGTNTYRLIKALLPPMVKRNKGAIICVSSFSAHAAPYLIPYGSEKAKINSFVELLQLELYNTNVFVQALLYGEMYTPSYIEIFGEQKPGITLPLPETAAKAGIRYFGCSKDPTIAPYWQHALLGIILDFFPIILRKAIVFRVAEDLRARYRKTA